MNITYSLIPRVHPFCCQGLDADQGSSLPDWGLILNSRDSQQEQRGRSSQGKEDENFLLRTFLPLQQPQRYPWTDISWKAGQNEDEKSL